MAAEVPREKLKELIEKNGDGLFQDRDRCEGLLKDYCGGYRRESLPSSAPWKNGSRLSLNPRGKQP